MGWTEKQTCLILIVFLNFEPHTALKQRMNPHLRLQVTRVKRETQDAISLYFDASGQIESFFPGQFLTLVLPFDGRGGVRRSYSICTTPSQLPEIGVCVKRVDNGLVSNLLNDNAKEGQQYEIIEPYGQFSLNHKMTVLPTLVLIGAGSGITPLMSILKTALSHPSAPKIVLLYGNRDEQNIIFGDEINALHQQHADRFRLLHTLSRPVNSGFPSQTGRIDAQKVMQLLQLEEVNLDQNTNFYVCGPEGMMHMAVDTLEKAGIPKSRLHKESFYHAPKVEVATNESSELEAQIPVTIFFEGEKHEVLVEQGQGILEAALDYGLDLPYACQMGICGMCRAVKVSGQMVIGDQESLSEDEIADGACLTCVGHPLGQGLVISYER